MSLTLTDVVHPIHMLKHVRIGLLVLSLLSLEVKLPEDIAPKITDGEILRAPVALRSVDTFADVGRATIDLTRHTVQMDAVLIFKVNAEVVVLVAGDAALTAAETGRLDRVLTDHPVEHIDVVDMLLDDVVASRATSS